MLTAGTPSSNLKTPNSVKRIHEKTSQARRSSDHIRYKWAEPGILKGLPPVARKGPGWFRECFPRAQIVARQTEA